MVSKKSNYFKIFEQFIEFNDENNKFLKKISGDCSSLLGIALTGIFSKDEDCMKKVKDYVEHRSKKLTLGETGYFNLSDIKDVSKDDMSIWFSRFVLPKNMTVGKGEVLLSILFKNVFKTPIDKNKREECGDLFISDDEGKTRTGRIEVKTALPGGLKFKELIKDYKIEDVDDGEKLTNAYNKFVENPLENQAMDKDIFIKLCAYCIARYMHRQFKKVEDYWLVIFDNQPHINSRGNIHDTESSKIRRIINSDGTVENIREHYDGWLPYGKNFDDESDPNYLPFGNNGSGYVISNDIVLKDSPTESKNGNEVITVKDMNGFLYIKRGKTINDTMKRILELIDDMSYVYKENKSSTQNNFTFYVKNEKICIAHRDNPVLIKKVK